MLGSTLKIWVALTLFLFAMGEVMDVLKMDGSDHSVSNSSVIEQLQPPIIAPEEEE